MRIVFRGTVQGVGFRPAVYRTAVSLGLHGSVRNDGSRVTVDIDRDDLAEKFISELKASLPPLARIDSVETERFAVEAGSFSIAASGEDGMDGASIPTDTAICSKCLEDMRFGRRKGYAFTFCTDCGPRFTTLTAMPYDRAHTSMSAFPMCPECAKEYSDPSDRRFHHQTICCPRCGPQYRLAGADGSEIASDDPIRDFAARLDGGAIGVAESWGGMHICCTLAQLEKLRSWYRRPQKPFAIMVRDIETAERYCSPTDAEREQLLSPHRPIVLVKKKETEFSGLISPGIDTTGVFLPYTGMQHLLFDSLGADALVMTSANPPGEPMATDPEDAFRLGADCYLLHNQAIVNRADDTVLRMCGDSVFYIRKSRGAIPSFYEIPLEGGAAAVGAQENLAGAVAWKGRIYPTQYIGNGEKFGVEDYLEEAVRRQLEFTGCEPSVIAEDMHPAYANRAFAARLAEEWGAEVTDVQHHHAHAVSLMADSGIWDHLTVLALDGTGHGDDGAAWGGEVMSCTLGSYERLAHLQYLPLIGGQKAVEDIRRLRLAADLANGAETDTGFSDAELSVLSKLAGRSVRSSSFGRFLDALAYSLEVCRARTYDGEPAMKLEHLLARGHLIDGFGTETVRGEIQTAPLFLRLGKADPADEAYSAVHGVLAEMVSAASMNAEAEGEDRIGITGGVSYDVPIVKMAEELAEERGMRLIVHSRVPNGDGGISTGQAVCALARAGERRLD